VDLALLASVALAQPGLQVADAGIDEAAVFLELRLAGAARADAGGVPAEVRPHLAQARQGVFQLRQLDLQAGLDGAGAGGEYVEDQLAAVEDLAVGGLLQVADLTGAEVVVEDDDVG